MNYNPRQKSLKQTPLVLNFLENSWDLLLTNLFSLYCALSLPNVEPRVFWSTETAVMPRSTLGKGKRTQAFQDFWQGLYLVWREERVTVLLQGEILDHGWNIPAFFAYRWEKKLAWKVFYCTSFPARRLIQLVWLILCKYRRAGWRYFLWLECNTIHHGVGKILWLF